MFFFSFFSVRFNPKHSLLFTKLKYRKISIQIYSTVVNIHIDKKKACRFLENMLFGTHTCKLLMLETIRDFMRRKSSKKNKNQHDKIAKDVLERKIRRITLLLVAQDEIQHKIPSNDTPHKKIVLIEQKHRWAHPRPKTGPRHKNV